METRVRKDVFEIPYMRLTRTFHNTLAQWPNRELGSTSRKTKFLLGYRYFLYCLNISTICGTISYFKINFHEIPFIDAGQQYTNIIIDVINLQRTTLPFQKRYTSLVRNFVFEFHLLHHQDISEYAVKQYKWIDKLCRIFTRVIQMQLYGGVFTYNLFPLLVNFQNGMFSSDRPENATFEHSVHYIVPFDYQHSIPGYIVIAIYNIYASYNISGTMCFYDLVIFLMVFHILGHLNIILNSLENFLKPSYEAGTPEETKARRREYNEQAFVLLKKIIDHYQIIETFMKDMSNAFDITLCLYLGFFQIMCIICLLECATMNRDAIGKYSVLTLFIFQQLIQTSVIFELINTKSEKLPNHVYLLPWEAMDNNNRRAVLMLLRKVQTPMALKAGGMVPVGVQTMSSILKTSVSYFVFLSQFGK